MAKSANNLFFSEGLDGVTNSVNQMHICSQEPTTYTEATSTFSLGSVSMAPADMPQSDGSPSGRKITVAAKTINGSATGTGNHMALVETGATTLWIVTTVPNVGITTGVDQPFNSWTITILDTT